MLILSIKKEFLDSKPTKYSISAVLLIFVFNYIDNEQL